ncbi:MAG: flagellar basal body L-ring protein FlgH [Gemmataceae bacterium]|nr:flagellar basal body L-ring protein FlgH [Gemmataceae bacterium]
MRRWVLAVGGLGVGAAPVVVADSIWDRRDPRYAFLFQDNRARQVGDLLTIAVTETTVAAEQDARAQTRAATTSGQLGLFGTGTTFAPAAGVVAGGTGGGGGTTPAGQAARGVVLPLPSAQAAATFSGAATMNTNRVFTDRIGVTVVDIMPNGNLVVEGYRSRVVQGEERVLRITGVVRQQDVAVGNIVPSQFVANFRISYLGRGPATRTTRPGWLGRVYDAVRPF